MNITLNGLSRYKKVVLQSLSVLAIFLISSECFAWTYPVPITTAFTDLEVDLDKLFTAFLPTVITIIATFKVWGWFSRLVFASTS